MNWEYKNIFYPLKTAGLLGEQILDEVELEQAFNEYGVHGWELISLMNMRNGFVAIFKRPLISSKDSFEIKDPEEIEPVDYVEQDTDVAEEVLKIKEPIFKEKYQQERFVVESEEDFISDERENSTQDSDLNQDAGAIRIE